MTAVRSLVICAGALALAGTPALAQTPASVAKPAVVSAAAAPKPAPGRWTCLSRTVVEIAPVSFDSFGSAEAWVVVHRVKGEVVASERIDKRAVDMLRAAPCSDQGGVVLIG
jgi:hypothetical protein